MQESSSAHAQYTGGFLRSTFSLGLMDSTDRDLKRGVADCKLPGQIKQGSKRSTGEEGSSKTGFGKPLAEPLREVRAGRFIIG